MATSVFAPEVRAVFAREEFSRWLKQFRYFTVCHRNSPDFWTCTSIHVKTLWVFVLLTLGV